MEFAAWAYPWDVRDEGPKRVARRLAAAGVDELVLATNYHSVQAFTPHNPERRTYFARASSYFQPDGDYGRLDPIPHDRMDGDWVGEIAADLPNEFSLSSWTVGCHNSRIGMANRDVTIESAHGDDLVFGLCPSNPAVQTYLVSLVRDLATRGSFDRIELETFDYFHGTGFGWHHQKIHVELGTLGEFLIGLCFCEHCRRNATDAGVPVQAVRRTVANTIDRIVAADVPATLSPADWVVDHPDVADYLSAREDTLVSLYEDLSRTVGDIPLGSYVGMPNPGQEWLSGVDLNRIAEHVDYHVLPAYESNREAILETYRTVEQHMPGTPLHVGLLPGHPHIDDGETVTNIVDGLEAVGVPRVSFYNYGLLPERSLDWIAAATR